MDEVLKREILALIEESKLRDFIEVGVPSKGGKLMVNCDFSNPMEATSKFRAAINILVDNRGKLLVASDV